MTGDYWKGELAVDLMQEGVQHGRELAEVQESLGRGDLFCIDEEMRPDRARTARVDLLWQCAQSAVRIGQRDVRPATVMEQVRPNQDALCMR